MSKARDLANLLGGGTSGAITFGGTAAIRVPNGTTEQRPTPAAGMIRYNTTTGFAEVYDGNIWVEFGAPPPSISTVTPSTYNGESGTTFTINGANFTADATVFFITSGGTEVQSGTVSFVSGAQLTATTPQDFTVADEPLDVKVVQLSGQITKLDVIDCGGVPVWATSAGDLFPAISIYENEVSSSNKTLTATDPDSGATISYSITSGTFPSGLSLSPSTGVITGSFPNINSTTTYNFNATATDNAGNATARAFNIQVLDDPSYAYEGNLKLWLRAGYNNSSAGNISSGTGTLIAARLGSSTGSLNTIGSVSIGADNSRAASPMTSSKWIRDSLGGATQVLQDDKLLYLQDGGDVVWFSVPASGVFAGGQTDHTFCYWIMWENRSENYGSDFLSPIFHSWSGPNASSFIAHDWYTGGTGNVYLVHYANGVSQGTFNTPSFAGGSNGNKGVWFHVATVQTASDVKIYFNGTYSAAAGSAGTMPAIGSDQACSMNGRADGISNGLPGNYATGNAGFKSFGDARYYNTALPANAIAAIYAKSRSSFA